MSFSDLMLIFMKRILTYLNNREVLDVTGMHVLFEKCRSQSRTRFAQTNKKINNCNANLIETRKLLESSYESGKLKLNPEMS